MYLDEETVRVDKGPRLGHDPDPGHAGQHAADEGRAAPSRHVDEGQLPVLGVANLSRMGVLKNQYQISNSVPHKPFCVT